MIEWQKELVNLDDLSAKAAIDFWNNLTPGWTINSVGEANINIWVKKFGLSETLESMKICRDQYLYDERNVITKTSIDKAINYIPRVAKSRAYSSLRPHVSELFYIRGILKNRLPYVEDDAIRLLRQAYDLGVSIDAMKQLAYDAGNYNYFKFEMEHLIQNKK